MPTQMLGVCCTPNAFRSFCLIGNQIRLSLDWDVITSPSQMTSLLALSSSWSSGYQTHRLRSPLIKQKRNCLLRKEAEKVLPGGVSSWGSWNDGFSPVPLRLSPTAWCCMVFMQLAGLARHCITGLLLVFFSQLRPSTFNSWSASRSTLDNWASLGWPFRKPAVRTMPAPVGLTGPAGLSKLVWHTLVYTPIPLTCLSGSWTSHSHPWQYQTQLIQRNQIFPQCSPVILLGNNGVSHLKEFRQRAVSVLKLLFKP